MVLSIIICTYNREHFLKKCLVSIINQVKVHKDFSLIEILIIDNNSQDRTKNLIEQIQGSTSLQINYLIEHQQGLSYARNRGINESKGAYLAFVDDDATVLPLWIETLMNGIKNIKADVYGGPIFPNYEITLPSWIDRNYFIRKFKNKDGYLNAILKREGFSGGNMCIKKEIFDIIGTFNVNLGMIGEDLGLGEESEFFYRLYNYNKRCKLYNLDKMAISHFEGKEKLTKDYLRSRIALSGFQFAKRTIQKEGALGSFIVIIKIIKQTSSSLFYLLLNNKFKRLKGYWITKGLLSGMKRE